MAKPRNRDDDARLSTAVDRRRLGFAGRDIRDQIRLGSRGSGTEVSRLASKPLRFSRYRGGHRFSGYKHHLTIGSRPISLNISPLVRTTLLIASIVWTGIRMVRTTWRNPERVAAPVLELVDRLHQSEHSPRGARSALGVLAQCRHGASWPSSRFGASSAVVFRSVDDLKATINRFIADTNADPKPLVWTADPHRPRRCQTRETSVRVGPLDAAGTRARCSPLRIRQQVAGWSSSALQGQNKCRT